MYANLQCRISVHRQKGYHLFGTISFQINVWRYHADVSGLTWFGAGVVGWGVNTQWLRFERFRGHYITLLPAWHRDLDVGSHSSHAVGVSGSRLWRGRTVYSIQLQEGGKKGQKGNKREKKVISLVEIQNLSQAPDLVSRRLNGFWTSLLNKFKKLLALLEGFLFDVPQLFSCIVDLWVRWYACPSVSPPCFSYSVAPSAAGVYCSAPDSAYYVSDWEKNTAKWWSVLSMIKLQAHASITDMHRIIYNQDLCIWLIPCFYKQMS